MPDVTGTEPDVPMGYEPFSGQCSTDKWENCLALRWK